MQRILIIAYYFPPINVTAASRPHSWANNLKAHGIEPVVITRHWPPGNEDAASLRAPTDIPPEESTNPLYTVIRLPYNYSLLRTVGERWLSRMSLLRKLYYFILGCLGYPNIDMDLSGNIAKFLRNHLETNHYDGLVVTTPPFSLIRLAKKINREYGIPYVVDFRDLWNDNKELKQGYADKGMSGILNRITKRYISSWLTNASLAIVATPPMAALIERLGYAGPVRILLNGFENDLLRLHSHTTSRKESFVIACVGTLYAETDLDVFADGFLLFIQNNPQARLQVRLIGVGLKPAIETWFMERIPASHLVTTGRVQREEALREMFEAHVLFMPGWKRYSGVLTSRIFEYLAAGRNILIAPGDSGSVDALINETGAGKIAENSTEVCDFLTSWYNEWERTGKLTYLGKRHLIEAYSRERQAALFATYLKKAFGR